MPRVTFASHSFSLAPPKRFIIINYYYHPNSLSSLSSRTLTSRKPARCVPLPSARTETLRPINQRGEQSTNFFSGTYHISFTPTSDGISRSLGETAALRRAATRAKPTGELTALANPYGTVIPHSYTYAAPAGDRGERQSGSDVGRGTEYHSVARGTRNIRFRNELTLRPPDNPPSYAGSLPRDGDR